MRKRFFNAIKRIDFYMGEYVLPTLVAAMLIGFVVLYGLSVAHICNRTPDPWGCYYNY